MCSNLVTDMSHRNQNAPGCMHAQGWLNHKQKYNASLNVPFQGAVVNVSSAASIVPMRAPRTSYGVAKAAQDALTRSLALELAPKGVRVNAVLPGLPLCTHAQALQHALRGKVLNAGSLVGRSVGLQTCNTQHWWLYGICCCRNVSSALMPNIA